MLYSSMIYPRANTHVAASPVKKQTAVNSSGSLRVPLQGKVVLWLENNHFLALLFFFKKKR